MKIIKVKSSIAAFLMIASFMQLSAMESIALERGNRITDEKLRLFDTIVEATQASPNEAQRAYDLLTNYCSKNQTPPK